MITRLIGMVVLLAVLMGLDGMLMQAPPVSPVQVVSDTQSFTTYLVSTSDTVEARTLQESYPVGTAEIQLEITNHASGPLLYGDLYDFRICSGSEWLPLDFKEEITSPPTELVLESGETVVHTLAIDLFDPPLSAGVYRVAQLACYAQTSGEAFACTEISTAFILE